MALIGELFDLKMADHLVTEMNRLGFQVKAQEVQTPKGKICQIIGLEASKVPEAQDYFRVRMGLPGAPEEVDPAWLEIKTKPFGAVTKVLIVISVCIFLCSFNPEIFKTIRYLLFINDPSLGAFSSLKSLELWRLVTPIFLHFGWLHIIFNCMWIKDLGSYWESEVGRASFVTYVLILSILSNLAQYIAIGPQFGGLSGVVYGLFGLSWGRILVGDKEALLLPKRDIYLMVGWYFLCLTGLVGNIANVAHGVGLGVGLALSLVVSYLKTSEEALRLIKIMKVLSVSFFFCLSSFLIEYLRGQLF